MARTAPVPEPGRPPLPARRDRLPHRGATYVIDVGTHWRPGTRPPPWPGSWHRPVPPAGPSRHRLRADAAYVNFPDPGLGNWQHAYYGADYARLTEVKRRYDPLGLFRHARSVTGS
ncbi:BBE domain-containing protein [Streptomyces sp. NK15101]|uniref:BBE domain-containing protein n=1 Tax=Streptomyces sp. NK15101 TaxID=2873261 RepID=UPI001CEC7005|nr:BBE domain-containing protein [Streptomyces sp. NK15101]